jgi:hypothetical protein
MGKGGIVLIKAVESIDDTVVDWTDGVPVSPVPAKLAWFHQAVRTNVAAIAMTRMVRIWNSPINLRTVPGFAREPCALGDGEIRGGRLARL